MNTSSVQPSRSLPERGRPILADCRICSHHHACYVVERPGQTGPNGIDWIPSFVCLGCLMRAADPAARTDCAECVFPA